jgi:hypothetical protein
MAEKRFLDFLDRIDGGGMGQSGDTFEGGGLLSMLGNLLASPYGSEDPERRARRDAFYAGQMGGEPMAASGFNSAPMAASGFNPAPVRTTGETATGGDRRPAVLRQGMQPAPFQPQALSPLEQFGGQPPAPYQPPEPKAQRYSASGMNPTNVYENPQDRFARQLVEMLGPDDAQTLMTSNLGQQAYQAFIANNYNMPNY